MVKIDEVKVNKMVSEMEQLKFFNGLNRLPKEFYRLNDEEKAEAVKRYRMRNGLGGPKPNGME
jgi:hypothetical protein